MADVDKGYGGKAHGGQLGMAVPAVPDAFRREAYAPKTIYEALRDAVPGISPHDLGRALATHGPDPWAPWTPTPRRCCTTPRAGAT